MRRRDFLKVAGLAALGTAGFAASRLWATGDPMMDEVRALPGLDAPRNEAYTVTKPMAREAVAARYNNFYEFSRHKDDVWENAKAFQPRPWQHPILYSAGTRSSQHRTRTPVASGKT